MCNSFEMTPGKWLHLPENTQFTLLISLPQMGWTDWMIEWYELIEHSPVCHHMSAVITCLSATAVELLCTIWTSGRRLVAKILGTLHPSHLHTGKLWCDWALVPITSMIYVHQCTTGLGESVHSRDTQIHWKLNILSTKQLAAGNKKVNFIKITAKYWRTWRIGGVLRHFKQAYSGNIMPDIVYSLLVWWIWRTKRRTLFGLVNNTRNTDFSRLHYNTV